MLELQARWRGFSARRELVGGVRSEFERAVADIDGPVLGVACQWQRPNTLCLPTTLARGFPLAAGKLVDPGGCRGVGASSSAGGAGGRGRNGGAGQSSSSSNSSSSSSSSSCCVPSAAHCDAPPAPELAAAELAAVPSATVTAGAADEVRGATALSSAGNDAGGGDGDAGGGGGDGGGDGITDPLPEMSTEQIEVELQRAREALRNREQQLRAQSSARPLPHDR